MKQKDTANAGAGAGGLTQANLANLGGDNEKQIPVFVPNVETQLATLKYAPFKRGVMRFEDYNYNIYNPYILIDNVKGAKLQAMN